MRKAALALVLSLLALLLLGCSSPATEKEAPDPADFDFPGLGHVIQDGDSWQWQSLEL